MIRITSPYFCAGCVIENGLIVRAAPIIKYMIGKTPGWVRTYCQKKKWKSELL